MKDLKRKNYFLAGYGNVELDGLTVRVRGEVR